MMIGRPGTGSTDSPSLSGTQYHDSASLPPLYHRSSRDYSRLSRSVRRVFSFTPPRRLSHPDPTIAPIVPPFPPYGHVQTTRPPARQDEGSSAQLPSLRFKGPFRAGGRAGRACLIIPNSGSQIALKAVEFLPFFF